MHKQIAIPTAISSLRIAALPLFSYFYNLDNIVICIGLLILCLISDYFDGYVARKLNSTSRFGAFFDATTDFIIVFGIYVIFYMRGFYPAWLPLLIILSFLQFLITSHYGKTLFDPVGRYFGSALYIGIALTLLWPTRFIFVFVQVAFLLFFVVSIVSRVVSLTKRQN